MKRSTIIIAIMFLSLNIIAQKTDTTKLKIGDTKIIIIDKKGDETHTKKEKLEKGKAEFEALIIEKEKEIEKFQREIEEQEREYERQKELMEAEMDEFEKQNAEKMLQEIESDNKRNEEKIDDLEKELRALESGVRDIDEELDKDDDWEEDWGKDEDWSKKEKFDWEFDNEWHKNWDNLSPFGKRKSFRGHWAGFELGLANYVNSNDELTFNDEYSDFELDAGRSWYFGLNFAEHSIPFGRNAGIVTGVGTDITTYHLRENVNLIKDASNILIASPETDLSYSKNAFSTWNFSIPVLFELQFHRPKTYLAFGVVGRVKVLSWGKQKFEVDGKKQKEKYRSDFSMNSLRYGLTARLGFDYIKLFVNYDLVPLFQKDRGPELYPVSIGLTLTSF